MGLRLPVSTGGPLQTIVLVLVLCLRRPIHICRSKPVSEVPLNWSESPGLDAVPSYRDLRRSSFSASPGSSVPTSCISDLVPDSGCPFLAADPSSSPDRPWISRLRSCVDQVASHCPLLQINVAWC